MWETYFGFKKTPFGDSPNGKQLFVSAAWQQVNTRLEFLQQHPGCGLITGEVGAGKSTAVRVFAAYGTVNASRRQREMGIGVRTRSRTRKRARCRCVQLVRSRVKRSARYT